MSISAADAPVFAIELDTRQSQRLLEQAVRAGLRISLLPHTRVDGLPLSGVLVRRTPEGLLLRPTSTDVPDPALLVSVYCEATLFFEEARFLFSTHIIEAQGVGPDTRVEVAAPRHLNVLQRRRHSRRALRAQSSVWIAPQQEDGPALEAALLNISAGGLACRVDRGSADRCELGQEVGAEFTLEEGSEAFRLPVRTVSKTAGAAAGQIIISFEFLAGPQEQTQMDRLGDVLYGSMALLSE